MNTDQLPLPTTYRPEFAEQARKLCLLTGARDEELAGFFDVAPATLREWLASVPAFAGAVSAGRALADAEVADRFYRRATGYRYRAVKVFMPADALFPQHASYSVHQAPVPAAGRFWLKNRRPAEWRETVEAEGSHDPDPDSLSDEKLAAIVAGELGPDDAEPQGDPQ